MDTPGFLTPSSGRQLQPRRRRRGFLQAVGVAVGDDRSARAAEQRRHAPSFRRTRPEQQPLHEAAGSNGRLLGLAYDNWKKRFVVADSGGFKVIRPENGNDTVSEGIAYGMLIAVYLDDKALFDGL